jgi:hypothetical protein
MMLGTGETGSRGRAIRPLICLQTAKAWVPLAKAVTARWLLPSWAIADNATLCDSRRCRKWVLGFHFWHGRRQLLSGIAVSQRADVADRSGTSPRRFCTMFVICVRSELFAAIGAAAGSGEGKSAAAVTMAAKSSDRCQAASVTARLLRGRLWLGVFGGRPKPAAILRAGRLRPFRFPLWSPDGVRAGGRNGGPHAGRGVAHFIGP